MRVLDRATTEENHQRFVHRVIESEVVWYLSSDDGVANSTSNSDDEATILLFWSDRAYAKRAKCDGWEVYRESDMSLFDFLYRWLSGMSGDDVLAGTNWTQDLIGVEVDPFELREEIESRMSDEQRDKYHQKYLALRQT